MKSEQLVRNLIKERGVNKHHMKHFIAAGLLKILERIVCTVLVVGMIYGLAVLCFWFWRVNHPDAPWWGFLFN